MMQIETAPHTLPLFDEQGCLTVEALCFPQEYAEPQRAALVRHLQSCVTCAQQHTTLAGTVERLQQIAPQVTLTVDGRALARQSALREIVMRRYAQLPTTDDMRSIPWYRARNFWLSVAIGAATALLAALGLTVLW